MHMQGNPKTMQEAPKYDDAGWIAGYHGLDSIYLLAAIVVAMAFVLIFRVYLSQRSDRATCAD